MESSNWKFIGCQKCGMVIKTLSKNVVAAIRAHPHDARLMIPLLDEEDAKSRFGGGLMKLEIQVWPPLENTSNSVGS